MDFGSIKDQVSNLTLYDLKAGVRKVQNGTAKQTPEGAEREEADESPSCYELHRHGVEGSDCILCPRVATLIIYL